MTADNTYKQSNVRSKLTKPEMVLIDLDGTLVDSVPDLAYCVNKMLPALDLPQRGEEAVRNWVGNGVDKLIHRAISNSLEGEADKELFKRGQEIFNSLYLEHNSKRSQLYPGVKEALSWMRDNGYVLGCVTNKAQKFTLPLLQALDIASFFAVIVAGDSLPEKKPHPLPLLHAAKILHADPEKSLMIGDSQHDVKAARAAGFQVMCVTYGYNHGEDIRSANPDIVVDRLDEIIKLVD